jgi:hypothetical protein
LFLALEIAKWSPISLSSNTRKTKLPQSSDSKQG